MKSNAYQSSFRTISEEIHNLQQRQVDVKKQIETIGEEVKLLDNLSREIIDWKVFKVRKVIERI